MFFLKKKSALNCEDPGVADKRTFYRLDLDRPFADFDFVVFDTELTGLKPKKDEIISIGAVRIKKMRIAAADTFHQYAVPDRNIPTAGTMVHRITPDELKNARPITRVLPEFVRFCGRSILVGHFIGLDMSFVNRALKKHFHCRLHNPCLDTMVMARLYQEKCREGFHDRFDLRVSYNLQDLSHQFSLPIFAAHDALEDAMQTAYLFLYLVRKLEQSGYTTLKDIHRARGSLPVR